MPIEPRQRPRGPADLHRPIAARLGCALALSALTSACAVTPLPPAAPAPVTAPAPAPAPAPAATAPAPAPTAPAPAAAPASTTKPGNLPPAPIAPSMVAGQADMGDNDAAVQMLRYADRVRALTPAELALEVAAIGDPGTQASRQLQLAIALMHNSQPVDTARALGLAQRAASNPHPDAAPYKPVARLIANRLQEQRKLEEANDRQGQQLREQQRRIDQLNERLEAMRAIERSLNNRAPANGQRPPTP